MLLEVSLAEIVIGERHRRDMGDLQSLADSMREVGLLQPIGITDDHRLVFGERRVKAAQMLGWRTILARVVDIPSMVAGEHAENEIRKDFTPSERVAIVEAMRTLHRGGDRLSEQFRHGGIAAIATDQAVRRAGFTSQDQFERARRVVTDGAPELTAAMDSGKASITAAAMRSSFERHGIDHLSASSLNLWAAEPALWVMERLLGRRSPTSAAAARGKAVEQGIHVGLMHPDREVAACIAVAEAAFDRKMALTPDGRRDAEGANLAGYVQHGLAELRQYGSPTAYQDRVEIALDDVPVPVVGYLDWRFDQHGLLVDLKTAERLPSAIGNAHGRQGAVYARAHGNYGMRMAYVKPSAGRDGRAVAVYEMSVQDVRDHVAALRQIALRLERFLALSSDPAELAGLLVPDYDAFWWNHPITRANGTAVFGF